MEGKGIGITFLGLLQIVFIVLKLCGVINWSWWLVLIPLWVDLFIILVALIIFYIFINKKD